MTVPYHFKSIFDLVLDLVTRTICQRTELISPWCEDFYRK